MTSSNNTKTVSALEMIDKKIAGIKAKGKALRADCHTTLVMVIEHYVEHGDMTRLQPLTTAIKEALGSSMSAAVNLWVQRFVPSLKWNNDEGAFEHIAKSKREILDCPEDKPVMSKSLKGLDNKALPQFGDARKIPFFDMERDVPQKPFEVKTQFLNLIKAAERALEKNIKEGAKNDVSKEAIDRLKDVGVELGFIKGEDAPTAPYTGTGGNNVPKTMLDKHNGQEQVADAA